PVDFETWYRSLVRDEEYDPSRVWVVLADDRVVGFCQCWTSAFIKDVEVDTAWRGRGVGAALVTTALAAFAGRNVSHVDLKTDADNHAALSLYRRLGFEIVED